MGRGRVRRERGREGKRESNEGTGVREGVRIEGGSSQLTLFSVITCQTVSTTHMHYMC